MDNPSSQLITTPTLYIKASNRLTSASAASSHVNTANANNQVFAFRNSNGSAPILITSCVCAVVASNSSPKHETFKVRHENPFPYTFEPVNQFSSNVVLVLILFAASIDERVMCRVARKTEKQIESIFMRVHHVSMVASI